MTKLSERALLTTLHISAWSGMLIDREVTDAVNHDYKADKEAGRYNKRIVAAKFLQGVSSAHSRARASHRLLTLPWEDNGTRALATTAFILYTTTMKDCRLKAEAEVKLLNGQRDAIMADGKQRLGEMFDPDDYPTDAEIASKFGFDVEIKPMPDAGDFRAKLTEDQAKAIIKDIERRSNERLETAMKDVFGRIKEMVGRMSERLRDYTPAQDGNRAEGIIRDSLVYNINELASDILPVLNITNDPRIEELRQQLLTDLVEHSPEILRSDAKVRKLTLSKADAILKKVQGYMK